MRHCGQPGSFHNLFSAFVFHFRLPLLRNALFQAAKFVADESVFSPEFLPSARCVAALIVSADIHAFFANPHLLYPILIFSISHYQLSQCSRFIFARETF